MSCLRHFKGEHAGKPFKPDPWQWEGILKPFYGTLRPDGLRQYRRMTIELPRKSGKSMLAAALGLYHGMADGEAYPEVVCAAGSQKQAEIVFRAAAEMVRSNPLLASMCTILRQEILFKKGGYLRCIAADGKLQHGLDCSAVIMDELHVWPNRELYEALTTSTLSRRAPAEILISTAGHDRESLWFELVDRAKAVLSARKNGNDLDPTLWPVIYEAPEGADWTSEDTWKIANPGYGISVKKDYFVRKVSEARASPAEEMSFKRLHLNIWGTTSHGFLPIQRWDDCAEKPPDLTGRRCWAALDLSSTTDLSALVLAFPIEDKIWLLPFAWAPRQALEVRERRNKTRFDNWVRSGHLYATEGEVINYEQIRAKINELSKLYKIQDIAIDKWNAHQMAQCLQADGFEVIGFSMGWAVLSPATKDFEQLTLGGKIRHDGHPVLRWCVANTAVESDSSGNIRPSKKKSSEKIDLCVASIMATARARVQAVQTISPYQSRGVRVL